MIQSLQDSQTIDLVEPFAAAPSETRAVTIDQVLEAARRRAMAREKLDRSLLKIVRPREHWLIQLMWIVVAAALVWALYFTLRSYWAPSHPGVDQNGYQVGGKLFSQTFSTGYKPINPYTYVGWMWVLTPDGYVYPKYPLGVPVLDAICIWLAPTFQQGIAWSYLVSPICTVLAVAAIFLMVRMFASSFAAILALILLATNPVALILAINSNSHAPDLCFVTWGMLWLLWWGKYGSWWRGLIAGLLLGYAVTIRYTEGLLILPVLATIAMAMHYRRGRDIRWWAVIAWGLVVGDGIWFRSRSGLPIGGWRVFAVADIATVLIAGIALLRSSRPLSASRWVGEAGRAIACAAIFWGLMRMDLSKETWKNPIDRSIVTWIVFVVGVGLIPMIYSLRWEPRAYLRLSIVLFGWLIPVVALAAFNKGAMGNWTGYDSTNESEGFSWTYFADKWDFMAGELHSIGLFFLAPIGIAGMALMYRWSWRVALIFTLWLVPGLLLYTAYYWGLNTQGVSYLRFFLTLLPPVIVCGVWMLDHAAAGIGSDGHVLGNRRGTVVAPIAGGIIVACAAGMNLYSIYGSMERDFAIQSNLVNVADHINSKATPAFEKDPVRQPILFGDSRQLLNYLQFAGNYECYSADVFTARYGQRIWGKSDPDAPNPLQPDRIKATHELYKNKSDTDLLAEATKIINTAISNQRHVYVALPQALMPAFRGRFITHDLTAKSLDTWREPIEMSEPAKKALLGLGPGGGFFGGHATPQNWELLEIIKKPPAPAQPVYYESKRTTNRATTKPKAYFEIK